MKKIININEFIFCIYIWIFVLIKPLTHKVGYSFFILLGISILLVFISMIINKGKFTRNNIIGIVIIYSILLILLIDTLIRRNNKSIFFIREFLIYGFIPIYLYTFTKNSKSILEYFVYFSIIVFIIYFFDPLQDYKLTGEYMSYGFNIMLPIFMSLHIGRLYLKNKKLFILELISFIQLCIFANKGSILTAIIAISIIYIFTHNITFNQIIKYIIISIIFFTLLLNILNIIDILIEFTEKLDFNSYSLISLKIALTSDLTLGLSGRDQIWYNAWNFIKNDLVIGKGVGAFYSYYNYYSHNFILDILIYYGIIGMSVFCCIWIKALIKIFKTDYYNKIFMILTLVLWIVPLFTSTYIFKNMYFWVFIVMAFTNNRVKINQY